MTRQDLDMPTSTLPLARLRENLLDLKIAIETEQADTFDPWRDDPAVLARLDALTDAYRAAAARLDAHELRPVSPRARS